MEVEPCKKVVGDVMNLQQLAHRDNIFRSLRNYQNRYMMKNIQVQSHDHDDDQRIIVEQQKQNQENCCWRETVDPVKLVLGKVIGRGSFGVVHKASYHGQTVAVKVLDFGDKGFTNALAERMKKDFVQEVGLWQNLDHPNITKMIGATMSMKKNPKHKNIKGSETESNFCIVSEYVKQGSLRSYLSKNKNKKLPMSTVLRFALGIAKGLSYLHSKKIIHRDVKPENMLVDKQHTIKLADFGESVIEPSGLLFTSGETGTRGYMAPEVVSRKPYGHKCDVYSFGICLWEIYCCDMAYTYDLDNITANIYEEMRPSIPVTCPRPLAGLMERCWDTNPKKRPEMKDVIAELEEIGKSEGWQMEPKDQEHVVYSCFGLWRQGR